MKKVCDMLKSYVYPEDKGYEEEFCEWRNILLLMTVHKFIFTEDTNTVVKTQEVTENFERPEDFLRDFGFTPMIEVYKEKNKLFTFNIEYDEVTIGRKTSKSFPDIDLSIYDQNKYLSRNHLAVIRLNDKYYARLLSSQNISYFNNLVMKYDEDYELKDGDKIILTKELGIIIKNI